MFNQMATKIINPMWAGFKITPKILVKNFNCRLSQLEFHHDDS